MNAREHIRKATPESEESVQMISFSIGSEHFGVRILVVQEIIMMSNITEIPNAPDFVEGVINLRGNIIPVLDLRKRLRLRNQPHVDGHKPGTRILVVEIEANVTGFIVDSVAKVITVPASKISPPPDIIVAGVQSQYISGVVHLDETILIVLDFKKILSIEEKEALDHVAGVLPAAAEGAA
ncbi:MAG: purine-binding chemotaxis protein CheW [Desulfomonile tiedjei]|nr:purine-binding chemotaxis protein CheW [Desulfomonile tiedjei]